MLERLPTEIGHKVLLEHSDGPWELKDNINVASLVSRAWRHRFQPLRVPHLQTPDSLALARARPQSERERATTVLVGTPASRKDLASKLAHHPAVPADDFHEFLALHPNARHAVLVNLTEDTLIENETFAGDQVPYVYLQNYLTLCAVNVAINAHDLGPTDVYALKHLRIELVGPASVVDGLEALLTPEHLPHLRTLQIGCEYGNFWRADARFPTPKLGFLDRLEAIQVVVTNMRDQVGHELIPSVYCETTTPILYTVQGNRPVMFTHELFACAEYVQLDDLVDDEDFLVFMSMPNLKALFLPYGFAFSTGPDREDRAREVFNDFARRKVECVYYEPPVGWSLIDTNFQAYLRRKKSSV